MRKPRYTYPDFVSKVELERTQQKRYWLSLTVNQDKSEQILVILKNPSRANQEVSDKTVFNVSNYIFRNTARYKALSEVGKITILNLMPHFMTKSSELTEVETALYDPINMSCIETFCKSNSKVIIAWGNPPKGLYKEYEQLKSKVKSILKTYENEVFYVDRLTESGNPKHGQIWAYANVLKSYDLT